MKYTITHLNRARIVTTLSETPDGYVVSIDAPKRSLNQNSLIHPVVKEIQDYMEANGAPKRSKEWWRYYLLGKWRGNEIVPDPDGSGGFVVINKAAGTSGLDKHEASEFIEWMYAFGSNIGVMFKAKC